MAIPSQADIELPLLLELERLGGRVRKGEPLYSRVASHFPGLTQEDLRLTRESTGESLWQNTVDWARNALREKGELNGGERGVWEITDSGKRRLRTDLHARGLPESTLEHFINSLQTLHQRLGQGWQPKALAPRPRRKKGGKILVTPQPPPPPPPPGEDTDIFSQLRARLVELSPTQFEHLVGTFMESNGFREVRVTGRSHDGGIDGDCIVPFVDVKVAFQAKRFTPQNTVGTQLMQQFKGSIGAYERGIFITTSSFTPGAKEIAEGLGVRIVLVDGENLVKGMVEKGLGVKTLPVTTTKIDEDLFRNLGP